MKEKDLMFVLARILEKEEFSCFESNKITISFIVFFFKKTLFTSIRLFSFMYLFLCTLQCLMVFA